MTSPVDIVNIALTEIGAQATVSSINPSDGSTEGNVASILYTPKITSLMRAAHWNCMRKQLALTQLKAVVINGEASNDPPPQPWLYEYAYPADCLQCRFILPFWNLTYTGVPFTTAENMVPLFLNGPPVKYAVATDIVNGVLTRVILTNMPQAIMIYTFNNSDPTLWDPHFENAATSSLGAWFINALNRSRSLLQDQIAVATRIIQEARISDGNEGLTSADSLPDWMRVRQSGGPWISGAGQFFGGWSTFGFPGGAFI